MAAAAAAGTFLARGPNLCLPKPKWLCASAIRVPLLVAAAAVVRQLGLLFIGSVSLRRVANGLFVPLW